MTSPAGVPLSGAMQRIAEAMENEGHPPPRTVRVEEELKAIHLGRFPDDPSRIAIRQAGGLQHVLDSPKAYVREIWEDAFRAQLVDCEPDQLSIIGLHAVYFSPQSEDFFRPYQAARLQRSIANDLRTDLGCIITVVDDIYDVYRRLREDRHLYDPAYSEGDDGLSGVVKAVTRLMQLLNWRALEIEAAQSMSQIVGCPHYVIAAKHPTQIAVEVIKSEKEPLYLSHPITAARLALNAGDNATANEIIGNIEAMAAALMASDVVYPFLPTTIDEYRILRSPEGELTPFLGPRWPRGPYEETLFLEPRLKEVNPLDPGGAWDGLAEGQRMAVSSLLEVLLRRITQEINARDRILVEQGNGLILLRPYAGERISFGMLEEIRHRTSLVKHGVAEGDERRALILSPPHERAAWRVDTILEHLAAEAVIDNRSLDEAEVDQIADAIRANAEIMEGLEQGELQGAPLKACCELPVGSVILFEGMPTFADPLAGAAAVRRQEWLEDKWASLARRAASKDHIQEYKLDGDRELPEVPETEALVEHAEIMFG